jgi:non-specific serine/threonine protein kinase
MPSNAWTRVDDAPIALTEIAATAHASRIWVAGGLRADGAVENRSFAFDPASGRWSEGPRLPEGVHHSSLVSTGSELYLVGGYAGSFPGNPTAMVRRLDAAANRWISGPSLPEARAAGAAAFDGARIVFGGGVSTRGVARQVWSLEAGEWRLLGPLSRAREHLGAVSDGRGRTWFLGGRSQTLEANVGMIEVAAGADIRAVDAAVTPRSGVAAFWHPTAGACLAGGEGPSGTHAEVECVSVEGRVTALPHLAVSRHGLGAAVVGETAYILLGGERPGLFVSPVVEAIGFGAE